MSVKLLQTRFWRKKLLLDFVGVLWWLFCVNPFLLSPRLRERLLFATNCGRKKLLLVVSWSKLSIGDGQTFLWKMDFQGFCFSPVIANMLCVSSHLTVNQLTVNLFAYHELTSTNATQMNWAKLRNRYLLFKGKVALINGEQKCDWNLNICLALEAETFSTVECQGGSRTCAFIRERS